MSHASTLVTIMITAARKAANGLRRDFGEVEALQVSKKGASDFVSSADLRAEQTIFEELSSARPKYGFVMEERGEVEGQDNSNRWIVDPLDGTTNFLHGLGQFAISIALERDRQPYAGVIYNPISDELFWAEKGQGAFMNDRRLRVSGRSDLSEALFATGLPYSGQPGRKRSLAEAEAVLERTAGVRRFGAAALDLAFVAAGRFDAFWERNLKAWDIAAGAILVREAGGYVTSLDGKDDYLKTGEIIAGNPAMHELGLKIVSEAAAPFAQDEADE